MAFCFIMTAVISGGLNSLVMFTIRKTSSLHKPSYFLMAIIALADFLSGFIGGIMLAINHVISSTFDKYRSREWLELICTFIVACKAYGYILCGASICTLVAMSVDRLLAIKMKTNYNNKSRVFKIMGMCLVISWGMITFTACYITINATVKKITEGLLAGAISITITLITIITIYAVAYSKLKSAMTSRVEPSHSAVLSLQKYRKTLNSFVLVCVFLVACYTPFTIASIIIFNRGLQRSHDEVVALVLLVDISEYLVYCSATINPVLYVWRMTDLRNAMKQKVRNLFCLRKIIVEREQRNNHAQDENELQRQL